MELNFEEKPVSEKHRGNGVQAIWEVKKFPFKIRVGETSRPGQATTFYWTLLGTYVSPETALDNGKAGSRKAAEKAATEALEALLLDLKDWVEYARKVF
jgi:hypothetical protein